MSDLGSELYGERRHVTPAVTYTVLGAVFLLFGLLLNLAPPSPPPAPPNADLVIMLVISGFGALCLIIGLCRLIPHYGATWHLHERGIRLHRRGRDRIFRHEHIASLTLKEVRVYFHGVCTGEVTLATFRTASDSFWIKQVRRPGPRLDDIGELRAACDTVAGLIATRWSEKLARGEAIEWTKGARFVRDGLELGAVMVPWEEFDRSEIKDGVLRLWRTGSGEPILKRTFDFPNGLPGLFLLAEKSSR